MNARARRKFIRKFERDFRVGKASPKQWRSMVSRFATYLRSLPKTRQVEIVYELIALGNSRGGESLDEAILKLGHDERNGLAILVVRGWNPHETDPVAITLGDLREAVVGYLLSNPKPKSKQPPKYALFHDEYASLGA